MSRPAEDTLVHNARREAAFALSLWVVAMIYTLSYCYLNGYERSPESLTFVLWFPDWVFWGIVAPWAACVVISTFFAFRLMGDEPLGDEIDSEEPPASDNEVQHA